MRLEANHARPRALGRREFLKLSGAGIAATLFAAGAWPARASAQEIRGGSALAGEFREAAREYRVPVGILVAMGYVNTHLEMPPPGASAYERGDLHGWGGYGIMHLVENPDADTLAEASRLTGIPKERLKTDRRSNILGGAALLAASQGDTKPPGLGEWFGAIGGRESKLGGRRFETPSGVGGGRLYAEQVFGALRRGVSARTGRGEAVSLAPQRGI